MLNAHTLKYDDGGRIRNTIALPTQYSGGVGFVGGLLCIDAGAVDHVHQSNPFLADGRLAGVASAPAYFSQGGLPHGVGQSLAYTLAGAIDHYNAGLPYDATGSLCLAAAEAPPLVGNAYPNPTLVGGSNIVADVFTTMPTSHVDTAFAANPCDATYLGAGNPAYTFVGTGNSRFAISMNANTATNRGVTLPGGRKYRFSAEVQMINSDGLSTRLINVAAFAAGAVLLQDGASVVPDGTWQFVYLDFAIPTGAANCQLRHGMGMFNAVTPVGATQQTRDLSLIDIGAYP